MKRIFITSALALALLPWGQATAQDVAKHELGVHAGLGLSTLSYDLKNGSRDGKFGGNVGVTGTYFLTNNFGLISGLEVSLYNSKSNFENLTTAYSTASSEMEAIEHRTHMSNYSEKQNMTVLSIPIMAQLQTPISTLGQVYVQGGFKIAIPVSGKYTASATEYTTKAYFVDNNVEVEHVPGEGFGTFTGEETKGDLKKKVSVALAAEAGFKWNVATDKFLYTGLFLDYGLSSMVDTKKNVSVVEHGKPTPVYGANSVLSSQYRTTDATNAVAKSVKPFAVGIKLRLAFACGK